MATGVRLTMLGRATLLCACARRCRPDRRRTHSSSSPTGGASSPIDEDEKYGDFLVRFDSARLGYPPAGERTTLGPIDLTVLPASAGGHAVLGRNGCGKSLLSSALMDDSGLHLGGGDIVRGNEIVGPRSIGRVSFESHGALLGRGGSVYAALAPLGGRLSKAAEFLVVRFGLLPFLTRPVETLSTGEIRKVLLVRSLSTRPRLLVLDNAFDGLDVPSRAKLSDLVSRTIRGFRPDILVQGVSAGDTAHTQVLLITQRAEEIVDEVSTVSMLSADPVRPLRTESRDGRSGTHLLRSALLGGDGNDDNDGGPLSLSEPDGSPLPSADEIAAMWVSGRGVRSGTDAGTPLVEAENLSVHRNDAILLDGLDWTVRRGERWLVAGGNGAGKSTLSRLLARVEERRRTIVDGTLRISAGDPCERAGWVSSELHMSLARHRDTGREVLLGGRGGGSGALFPTTVGDVVANWLGIDESLLLKPFEELSQGEQKLVLIGAALVGRPSLLILDEACQGLDLLHRHRVLGLVDRVCRATDITLIYITHHLEEVLPSITHVLHLKEGKIAFTGNRESYNPHQLI